MEATPKILEQHRVDTVILACIDFRFREGLTPAIREAFNIDAWDEIKLAGGAKNISMPGKDSRREAVLDDLNLAVAAHHANTIILLNHQNCGKYASEGNTFDDRGTEHAFHEKELKEAGNVARQKFSNIKILLGYAYVDPTNAVRIEKIEP